MAEVAEKGNLQEMSFAKIFFSIAGRGKTGVLTIRDTQDNLVQKQIYFLSGEHAFVMYGPIDESLGQILLREHVLDESTLEEILEELAVSDRNIGDILISRKVLDQAQLTQWLERQTEIKLVSCFGLNESQFEFEETTVAKFGFQVKLFTIIPARIVHLGVKKYYSLKRLESEMEYVKDKLLKLSPKFEKKSASLGLSEPESALAHSLSAGQAFNHVISKSDLPLSDTLKLVYALLVTGEVGVEDHKSISDYKEPPAKIPKRTKTIELEEIDPEQAAKELNITIEEVPVSDDGNLFADEPKPAAAAAARTRAPGREPDGPIADDRALVKQRLSDILLTNLKDAIDSYVPGRGSGGAKIGELLVRNHVIDSLQLNEAVKKMRDKGGSLLTTLCSMGALQDDDLAQFLSKFYRVPAVNLKEMELDQEVVSLIPEELSKKYKAIPVNRTGRTLVVAMVDPTNLQAIEEIEFLTNYKVEPVVATEAHIKAALDKYHDSADMLDDVMSTFDDSDINFSDTEEEEVNASELEKAGEEAPVVKLVNQIINDAVKRSASDIHFEPYETAFRVRYRIDGVLYSILNPPAKLKAALVSRLKIMSKLDIAERRIPQDGRMSMRVGKKKLDFRVSTLPTIWGEKMVLRILDKSSLELDLTKLGMGHDQLEIFRWGIDQPYGMVLVTGPSGCGKTTTLYSALLELNKITDNVSTAEDPVEYYLEGINQVQMQDEIGLNFAFTLRAFLRQDPDIIMVGEVRDFETAEISIKAALTGHLVLSTVHTNDAPSTVSRLLNMGIEPFLLTASLNTVVSQRLVRKLCPNCMEPVDVPKKTLINMGLSPEAAEDFVPYMSKGCSACSDRGYKGRIGLYEILKIRGEISDMIIAGATPGELKREAMRMGMKTLRQSGLLKVKSKETSLEEVTRTTMPDFIRGAGDFKEVDE
jgi:type IV pilus assembly protein PilB